MLVKKLLPAIIWALIVLFLTGFPGSYIPRVSGFWDWLSPDKIVHVLIFGTLCFLIFYGLREQYFKSKKRYVYALAVLFITFLYGMATEILQRYVFIGRDGNLYDFLADAAGGILGFLAFILLFNKKKRQPKI